MFVQSIRRSNDDMVCVPLQEVSIVCDIITSSTEGSRTSRRRGVIISVPDRCCFVERFSVLILIICTLIFNGFILTSLIHFVYLSTFIYYYAHTSMSSLPSSYQMQLHRYVCHPILPVNDIIMLSLSMYVIARTDPILSSSESMNANHSMK